MATAVLHKASWLALFAVATTVTAQSSSAFWTFTTRYQDCISTYSGMYSDYTYSSTCTIKDSVTPTVEPYEISTPTSDSYDYYYGSSDLAMYTAWYTAGAVPDSDLKPTNDYYATTTTARSTSTYYDFSMLVTYTAPADCPTAFTITTNASVDVPTQVLHSVTPYAVDTSIPVPTARASYIYETWYLSGGEAPFTSTKDYYYTEYIEQCSTPYQFGSYSDYSYTRSRYTSPTDSVSGGTSGNSGDSYRWDYCYYGYGCTNLRVWVIVIAAVIPSLFVLGFFESYFWFRRLMLGKGCLRFGTISWICISLWVACFTRSQSRRSPEDQLLLRQKWKETSFGTAIKLWFKWGFRHRYPVPLLGQYSRNTVGIVPEGQPLPAPGMVQTNGNYPGGPQPPPGAFIPNGQGQPYYPPPQGWAAAPNGQGYPMPPPGQPYMPNGTVQYYGEQTKDAPSVTATSVSPVNGAPQPAPSPVSPTVSPHVHNPNVAEAPAAAQVPVHPTEPQDPAPTQLPTHKDSAV